MEQLDGAIYDGPHDIKTITDNIDGKHFGKAKKKPKKSLWKKIKEAVEKFAEWVLETVEHVFNKISPQLGTKLVALRNRLAVRLGRAFGPIIRGLEKAARAIARGWKAIVNSRVGTFFFRYVPRIMRFGGRMMTKVGGYVLLGIGAALEALDIAMQAYCSVEIAKKYNSPDPDSVKLNGYCEMVRDDMEWMMEVAMYIAKVFCSFAQCGPIWARPWPLLKRSRRGK